MTDAFRSMTLGLIPAIEPVAQAGCEAELDFLTGPALRAVIAERLEQIVRHGHTPATDLFYQGPDLGHAALTYLASYLDLECGGPDYRPSSPPDSWPWLPQTFREPTYERRAHALTKALALGLAELDRLLAAMDLLHAARPLGDD